MAIALAAALAAFWSWRMSEGTPDHTFIRIAIASAIAATIVGLIGADTRPRLMLRFVAALFALVAVIAYAADFSRPPGGENSGAVSLLQYLQNFAPVFVAAAKTTIERWFGSFMWDPVMTTVLSLPAYLLFLLLALAAGLAGRPRHRVQIFVNDQ